MSLAGLIVGAAGCSQDVVLGDRGVDAGPLVAVDAAAMRSDGGRDAGPFDAGDRDDGEDSGPMDPEGDAEVMGACEASECAALPETCEPTDEPECRRMEGSCQWSGCTAG